MMKLHHKKLNIPATDRLLKPKRKNHIFKVTSSQSNAIGSSMIELLLATALTLSATVTAAKIMNNLYNSGMNRRAAATSAIDVAISNDLAWFRQYAVLWRLERGPFQDLSTDVTRTNTYGPNQSPESSKYVPIHCNASAMAIAFRDDAANSTTYVVPINSPPNPVSNSNAASPIALPAAASGYTLVRRIQAGPTFGTLTITYALSDSVTTLFERASSLYLPAAGWCP